MRCALDQCSLPLLADVAWTRDDFSEGGVNDDWSCVLPNDSSSIGATRCLTLYLRRTVIFTVLLCAPRVLYSWKRNYTVMRGVRRLCEVDILANYARL